MPMTLSPEQQAALSQMFSSLGRSPMPRQGMPDGMMPQGTPNLQGAPQIPPAGGGVQMPKLGGANNLLPGGTASPAVPGVPMNAGPGYKPSPISGHGIGMIPAAVMAIKQKLHKDKVEKYHALANEFIAQQENPDQQKMMAEQAKASPEIAKAYDKKRKDFVKMHDEAMKDPNSAAAQGIQRAYQDQVKKEQDKMNAQQFQAQIAETRARIEAETQRGKYWSQMGDAASRRGEVTPEDEFKAANKNMQVKEQIQAKLQISHDGIAARRKNVQDQIASLEKRAKQHETAATGRTAMHEAAATGRTAMSQKGANARAKARIQQDQATNAMLKEYKNLETQYASLEREEVALNKEIVDKPVSAWFTGQDDVFNAKTEAIESRRAALEAAMDQIKVKVDTLTEHGTIPAESGGPIVVSPEDMKTTGGK